MDVSRIFSEFADLLAIRRKGIRRMTWFSAGLLVLAAGVQAAQLWEAHPTDWEVALQPLSVAVFLLAFLWLTMRAMIVESTEELVQVLRRDLSARQSKPPS
jgi:hypothetical protein